MKAIQTKTQSTGAGSRAAFFGKGRQGFFHGGHQADPFFSGKATADGGVVQSKLTVGEPNDVYEKEADSMADKVVQRCVNCGSDGGDKKKGLKEVKVSRKPIFESEAEPPAGKVVQRCPACDNENSIQRKGGGSDVPAVSMGVEHSLQSSKGGGSPLPVQTRSQMESSFGQDFSAVRVHTDAASIQMSKDLNAQAFTHGSDIYFNSGKYDPGGRGGQHLLAHELTHVVQQSQGMPANNISKREIGIQRALTNLCMAPSYWGMPPPMWITIGQLAHLIGMNDYITKTGGVRGADIYLDTFELIPIDPAYGGFITRNNPGLAAWKTVFLSYVPIKRPDYMIHRPGLTEYDELKPNSVEGVLGGLEKIYEIAGYMAALGLPYIFGTAYTPTRYIPLFSFSVGGVPVNVSLKFMRYRSGLIVYELCIETDWALVVKTALIALIIAMLVYLLKNLPIPFPIPVPNPVPIPAEEAMEAEEAALEAEEVTAAEEALEAAEAGGTIIEGLEAAEVLELLPLLLL